MDMELGTTQSFESTLEVVDVLRDLQKSLLKFISISFGSMSGIYIVFLYIVSNLLFTDSLSNSIRSKHVIYY